MPLGSYRLNTLARYIAAIPPGPGPDTSSKYLGYYGTAEISTTEDKFGGSSLRTNGSSEESYLLVGYHPDLVLGTSDFTIEFSIYFDNLSSFKIVIDGRTAASSAAPCIYTSGNSFNYFVNGSTLATATLSDSTWYHVAIVRSSGTGKMFINGTQAGSSWSDTTDYVLNSNGFYFSKDAAETTPGVDGYYDEIRFSNTARYTSNFTAPTDAFTWDSNTTLLIHADSFDGSKTAGDDNGGRQAINLSEPVTSTVTVSDTQSMSGSTSLYFSGSGANYIGSIYRGNNTALPIELVKWYNDPGWTLEYWFYTTDIDSCTPAATTSGGGLVGQRFDNNDPAGQWWGFGPRDDGEVRFTAFAGPHRNFVTTDANILENTWHHIAFVFDYGTSISNSTVTIWVDGQSRFTQTVGSDGPYIAGDDNINDIIGFVIGSNLTVTGDAFIGYVDSLRVSKVARYTDSFSPEASFVNDADTVLLLDGEGTVGERIVRDNNSRVE